MAKDKDGNLTTKPHLLATFSLRWSSTARPPLGGEGDDEEDEDGLRRSRPSLAAQRRSFEETGFKGGRGDD